MKCKYKSFISWSVPSCQCHGWHATALVLFVIFSVWSLSRMTSLSYSSWGVRSIAAAGGVTGHGMRVGLWLMWMRGDTVHPLGAFAHIYWPLSVPLLREHCGWATWDGWQAQLDTVLIIPISLLSKFMAIVMAAPCMTLLCNVVTLSCQCLLMTPLSTDE